MPYLRGFCESASRAWSGRRSRRNAGADEVAQGIVGETVEPMTVEAVARQLPLTRRSLERRFRNVVGHTIHEEIVYCRLERAARLLVNTHLSIQEVSMAAGFASTDTMGRVFHRIEGMSPRDYRKQHGR